MRDSGLYLLYRAALFFIGRLPLSFVFRLGQFGGICCWVFLAGYRRLALRNLQIAFPGKPAAELRRICRRHFASLGANLLSGFKMGTMPVEQIERHVQLGNLDAVHQGLRSGRPLVLVLSHLGNWELCAHLLPKYMGYVRNGTVYQRLRQRRIDQHLRASRERFGVEMFDRAEGFQKAIQLLRGGGVLGILCDQHAGDKGLWLPFFGKLASTTPLPALLAHRTNAALVSIVCYTAGVARWRVEVSPVKEAESSSANQLTNWISQTIENQIRSAPADWFWVHHRWKTPRPNFLLQRYKRGIFIPNGDSPLQPFRILIRSSNWLGDAVMSVPAIRALKGGRPDAHVTLVTPEKLKALWKKVPEIDEVIAVNEKSLWDAVTKIRRAGRFDVAVLFPNSLRSALEAWLARIPRRMGYRGHARAWLINQVVRKRRHSGRIEHQASTYLRMAQEAGAEIPPHPFSVSSSNNAAPSEFRLGLCPGAEYGPAKRWLPERFAAVAQAVSAARPKAHWTLFGTANDAVPGGIVASSLGDQCTNRIGQTTLEQLINELSDCHVLLTNDTGTMHLAALLNVPTVSIFGSTEPRRTAPLGNGHRVIRHHVECSPCFLRECPIDFRCMNSVTVEEVTAAVLDQIKA